MQAHVSVHIHVRVSENAPVHACASAAASTGKWTLPMSVLTQCLRDFRSLSLWRVIGVGVTFRQNDAGEAPNPTRHERFAVSLTGRSA